ncbi:MAG: hypothetical protein HYV53_03570 [Parcubacteria group bacterium]|nr:hypothetical protein [Parcubacteria group bacterium]
MQFNEGNEFNLREAIIKVIAFFDLFDYALTDFEIWRVLSLKCQLSDVAEALESLGQIENKNGFYFLAGRSEIILERLKRYDFTNRKFKRARLAAKIFRFIPWIKMIAAGNLLGAHNLKDESDIDFFIVAEDKRVWLTRFFCASLAKFLGWRPRAGNSRDKICLSFYVSEWAMDLSGVMLKNPPYPPPPAGGLKGVDNIDIYFIYWLAGLTPLYDVGGVYQKLIKVNQWLFDSLPNWRPIYPVKQRQIKPVLGEFYHDLADLLLGGLEPQFKALQLKLLPWRLKNLMNQDSRVVINDKIIKLHANDRREEYRGKYEETIRELK